MTQTRTLRTAAPALCSGIDCRQRAARGSERRLPEAGRRLCTGCREGLSARLTGLPGLYRACEEALGGSLGRRQERTSGGRPPGMPFNGAAAEARSAILGVLSAWCGLVAEERGVPGPRRAVDDLARFLDRHADWLSCHPAAEELTEEVRRLVGAARSVLRLESFRRVPVGVCAEPGCPGRLTALVRVDEPAVPMEITCGADQGHRWTGQEWLRLSRRLAGPAGAADRWLTAAQITQLWGIPSGSVYRLASEHRWRRRRDAGRTYYLETDVDHCFAARAGEPPLR